MLVGSMLSFMILSCVSSISIKSNEILFVLSSVQGDCSFFDFELSWLKELCFFSFELVGITSK
jgi:hypothetical protein